MRTAFEDGRGAIVFHPTPDPAVTIVVTGMGSAPHLLGCLRSVAHSDPSVPFEVIVSLNRPSPQLIDALGNEVEGVTVLTSRVNRGFGGACNQAASLARGECILFLNDDTVVDHYWLRELVDMLRDRPGVGAVGSRMLHLDGSLQESGSFLWSDGSTNSAAGERDNPAGDYRWARAVDYCSAASLMVRRSVWERLGGFDDDYYPAYYEDVDLCLRIWALGLEVWCQPTSVVWHHRSTSSARGFRDFLMARGRRILREKHAATLAAQPDRTGDPVLDEEAGQRHRSGGAIRLLVVDDRVPDGALGSGYRRMADALAELAASGSFRIDFHATDEKVDDAGELARRGIRLLDGELDDHLRRPHVHYGAVVLSRPHNFERHGSAVRRWQPDAALIYDAEAMYFRRTDRHAALAETTGERTRLRHEAASMRSSEEALVRRADRVISICEEEAALARAVTGAPPVHVIEARLHGIEPTRRRYRDRRDIVLVAGWLAGPDSPNADGLLWFLRRVFPIVRARLPWVRLRITGQRPPDNVLEHASTNVCFEGRVADLHDFYDRARVAIAPIRFGAGVKLKTIEALQFGVPTVSTEVGAEGIPTASTGALLVADDPVLFAEHVCALLDSIDAWETQRRRIEGLHRLWTSSPAGDSWVGVVTSAATGRGWKTGGSAPLEGTVAG